MVPLKVLLQLLGPCVLAAPTLRYCVHILLQLLRTGYVPFPDPCCSGVLPAPQAQSPGTAGTSLLCCSLAWHARCSHGTEAVIVPVNKLSSLKPCPGMISCC